MLGRLWSVRSGCAAVLFLCLWGLSAAVAGELPALKGIALVIGQTEYQSLARLANPKADARAMEERLAALGFKTDLALDETARKLKRTVSGFIEDAEGADVALVYYSGHAIEAGGVNYLIPVDAGLSSLEAAAETLVPLQDMLDALRGRAKVTILLLDACRTNPFPVTARVKKTAAARGEPILSRGLAATRGAVMVAAGNEAASESLGEMVGYAAEPGQAALDGPDGANSPYAAALLKHLSANRTYDFGQVMTLVTEEVYLRTGTRQRPWTNASLRRFLTFGGSVEDASPDDALITDARRRLLITIAATPQQTRSFVEALAREQNQSLDLVYGMLKELQVATTADPETIEQQLREGIEQAKKLLAERDALRQDDPQVIRLVKLAEQAEAEGTLTLATEYWREASMRTDELAETREKNKTDVMMRARRAASVYTRHAEAAALASDYQTAAREYGKAVREIEGFDKRKALGYRLWEAEAFRKHGMQRHDAGALRQALSVYAAALETSEQDHDKFLSAARQVDIGRTLLSLDDLEGSTGTLREAVVAFEAALAGLTRADPIYWAGAQHNLGNALTRLGERENNMATLRQAVIAYEAALSEPYFKRIPRSWARTQDDLGITLLGIASRDGSADSLRKAAGAFEAALAEYKREGLQLKWAAAQYNLGNALAVLGEQESGTETLRRAVDAFEAALGEHPREKMPLRWARTQNSLGYALALIGERTNDAAQAERAVAILRPALAEQLHRNDRLSHYTADSLCRALLSLGALNRDRGALVEARGHCLSALAGAKKSNADWAARKIEANLARVEKALAQAD